MNKWIDSLVSDLSASLESSLADDPATLVRIFPAWERIEISERAEDGSDVRSEIQVPHHPSLALSCALASYCAAVYAVAPHSLSPQAQTRISREPARATCVAYRSVASRGKLAQRVALQLHFDLQVASQCFVSRDSRDLSSEIQSVLSLLETHVDPFDLSVFSPYMSVNVKRAVLRQSGLYSILIPPDRHALLASLKSSLPPPAAGSSSSKQQPEQHNVMWTLGHRPEKIPIVPVPRRKRETTPSQGKLLAASAATLTAHPAKPLSTNSSRRKRDRSPVAKATGSFFEAMSTSWFGGK